MIDYVELSLKRNRGWPWPEDSLGLTPMFGEDGWCRSCGVPKHPQTGSLVLQRKGMPIEGAWVPNWQFDAYCLERTLAEQTAGRFRLDLLPVRSHTAAPAEAMQIVVPSVGDRWFDHDELSESATNRHRRAGAKCADCGVWRRMPLRFRSNLPPLRITPGLGDADIAASPEWFGDGWKAFRQILVRRELAELIVKASPRDFKIQEVA